MNNEHIMGNTKHFRDVYSKLKAKAYDKVKTDSSLDHAVRQAILKDLSLYLVQERPGINHLRFMLSNEEGYYDRVVREYQRCVLGVGVVEGVKTVKEEQSEAPSPEMPLITF